MRFPTVAGETLSGRSVELPDWFGAPRNLAVVSVGGFDTALNGWTRLGRELERSTPEFMTFRVHVAVEGTPLTRATTTVELRSDTGTPSDPDRTVACFLDVAAFRGALSLRGDERVGAYLVTPNGRVLWNATGAATPLKAESLEEALTAPTP